MQISKVRCATQVLPPFVPEMNKKTHILQQKSPAYCNRFLSFLADLPSPPPHSGDEIKKTGHGFTIMCSRTGHGSEAPLSCDQRPRLRRSRVRLPDLPPGGKDPFAKEPRPSGKNSSRTTVRFKKTREPFEALKMRLLINRRGSAPEPAFYHWGEKI